MALVSKILEATLAAGSTSVTFTDSDIPNSLIRVFSSDSNIIPESRILSGTSLTVIYAPQTNAIGVALEIVKQGLDIVDDLTSTDTDKALSAKQGKTLKDLIDSIPEGKVNISDMNDVDITDIEDGQVLAWDAVAQKFVNVDQSGGGSSNIYSTTETIIGEWLGEPLYRKVFTGLNISLTSNAWTTLTGVNVPNGKDLINAVCFGTYSEQYIIGTGKIHLDSSTGNIEVRNIDDSATLTAIYLEYTKSS